MPTCGSAIPRASGSPACRSWRTRRPGHVEGALAVARAALDAREFATARAALAPYLAAPTQRVAALMAEIEEAEHGDNGRVREWMAAPCAPPAIRSGPPTASSPTAGCRSSPSGRLDGFEWRVPLAEIGVSRPVIEMRRRRMPGAEPARSPPSEPAPAAAASRRRPPRRRRCRAAQSDAAKARSRSSR